MNHWPKIELHLHLDCNLSYAAARRLKPGLTEQAYRGEIVAPAWCPDHEVYFDCTRNGVALMQNRDALRLVVADTFEQLAQDGVIYAELRFAPLLHTQGGLSGREVVATVAQAMGEQIEGTGIEAGLILATLRHFSAAQSLETAELAIEFAGQGVAAFDIAGNEELYPLARHLLAFEKVVAHGLPFTVHAGEGQGPRAVWEALEALHPRRIGHGVRSIGDPALVQRLKDEGVHLEVCPTTNVQMNLFPSYADHPIQRLAEAGVSCGVNTDTRATSDHSLRREYARLAETFGWGKADFYRANRQALAAAFVEEGTRWRLRRRLEAGFATDV